MIVIFDTSKYNKRETELLCSIFGKAVLDFSECDFCDIKELNCSKCSGCNFSHLCDELYENINLLEGEIENE